MERGRIQGLSKLFEYPQERGKATDFKFGGYIYRAYPNKSPLKFFSENGVWAYPGTAQIFLSTPYYLRDG